MQIMGGMNRDQSGPQFQVDSMIATLGLFSFLLGPIAFLVYLVAAITNREPRLPDHSVRPKK